MKITADELLIGIIQLGEGTIDTRKLRSRLNISNGQFYQLRKILIDEGRLIITHPCRAAHYQVPQFLVTGFLELAQSPLAVGLIAILNHLEKFLVGHIGAGNLRHLTAGVFHIGFIHQGDAKRAAQVKEYCFVTLVIHG